jgi:dTDP-L-rhamnose 4-epimerase
VTKRDQEELFLVVGGAYGIPTAALRLFNVYGPRQALSNPYTGVLAIFASRMLNGARPLVFEDGGQSRDFIHVRDVARALVTALTTPAATGVFNVGTGRATSVLELGERLAARLGYDGGFRIENRFRTGDIRHAFADVTRIRESLGFRAEIGLDEGLRDTTAWIRAASADDRVDEAARVLEERGLLR